MLSVLGSYVILQICSILCIFIRTIHITIFKNIYSRNADCSKMRSREDISLQDIWMAGAAALAWHSKKFRDQFWSTQSPSILTEEAFSDSQSNYTLSLSVTGSRYTMGILHQHWSIPLITSISRITYSANMLQISYLRLASTLAKIAFQFRNDHCPSKASLPRGFVRKSADISSKVV